MMPKYDTNSQVQNGGQIIQKMKEKQDLEEEVKHDSRGEVQELIEKGEPPGLIQQ